MKLTIDGKSYDADPDQITNKEGMAIERVTDWQFEQWLGKLKQGSMLALTAFAWVLMRRDEPELRFDDVEFTVGEYASGLELSDDEARAALAATKDDESRAQLLAALPEDQRGRVADPTAAASAA